jgi:serine/threonine-protein phosphatase 2A regulatory subunit B'
MIMLEEQWPHLQIVYELLLRLIIAKDVDTKVLQEQIDSNFLHKLFELFKSPDPMERDYLKTIVHRIYSRFMNLRLQLRQLIIKSLLVGLAHD